MSILSQSSTQMNQLYFMANISASTCVTKAIKNPNEDDIKTILTESYISNLHSHLEASLSAGRLLLATKTTCKLNM